MNEYCPSFETIRVIRNKLSQLEPIVKKTVGEQLKELNDLAISLDSQRKSGIYVFHSKKNDMIYIGSAEKSLKGRYNSHIKA